MKQFTRLALLALVALTFALPALAADSPPAKLRVLIYSGQNNHDWRTTTPVLQAILTAGSFQVEVTEHPEQCNAVSLAGFDCIVSNWNNWDNFGHAKVAVAQWPEQTRKDFLDFVRSGHGFVVVHAGGASFPEWPEFQKLIGGTWGKETGHGRIHAFEVKFTDADSPITKGLRPFSTTDELWHRMATQPEKKVLARAFSDKKDGGSGQDEIVALTTEFGRGRCFNLVLGHDAAAMKNAGFQKLLLRGVEWAATGRVGPGHHAHMVGGASAGPPCDSVLKSITAYKFGDDRTSLLAAERLTLGATDPVSRKGLAAKYAALLAGPATPDSKCFICRQLGLIGGAAEVPALEGLLLDEEFAFAARSALERIPGEESLAALRRAAGKAKGLIKVGLIESLQARQDGKTSTFPRALVSDAGQLLAALSGDDHMQQSAAIRALHLDLKEAVLNNLADKFASMSPAVQIRVVRALADTRQAAALPIVTQAIFSKDPAVRQAGLVALGSVGNATSVPLLLDALRSDDKDFVKQIEDGLVRLRGPEVNAALVAALSRSFLPERTNVPGSREKVQDSSPAQSTIVRPDRTELLPAKIIRALAARSATEAVPVLLVAAQAPNSLVRAEAIRALGNLADEKTGLQLVELLDRAGDRAAVEAALVAIYRDATTIEPLLDSLRQGRGQRKASLVTVLGALGGPKACDAVRKVLKTNDPDARRAAVRALAAWPDAAPLDDLLAEATATGDTADKGIALRGVANLAPLAADRKPQDRVTLLRKALALCSDKDQIKPILTALGKIPVAAAATLAGSNLKDPALRDEAALAIAEVAEALGVRARREIGGELKQARAACDNPLILARLAAIPLGENLALGGKATNPDGLAADGEGGPPQSAIDGNPETYWDEVDNQKLYQLRVAMQKPAIVATIRIMGFKHHDFAPKDFEILCDGKVVKEVREAVYQKNLLTVCVPPTRCTTVELKITGYYGGSPAIRELEIYGPEE